MSDIRDKAHAKLHAVISELILIMANRAIGRFIELINSGCSHEDARELALGELYQDWEERE